jgi:PAS domain S-box-containing protein
LFLTHLARAATGNAATDLRLRGNGSAPRPARMVSRRAAVPHARSARYYTILTDVTEQRHSEHALRVSEKRHREIVETSNEGICIVNERNEIVFANRRFGSMVGTIADDLLGRSALELVPEEDVSSARSAFDARETSSEPTDERLRRFDGTLLPAMVSTTIMRDDHGRFTGMLRMYTDATSRQQLVTAREMLVRELVAAQERERQRIARELHDQTGQHIVALTLGLARLASSVADMPSATLIIDHLRSVADSLGKDVHTLAMELRPSALDHLGLAPALTAYVDAVAARVGLDIDVHCDSIDDLQLNASAQTGLYRIAQEALTNVVKHARAQHASVILERRGDALQLIVEDDGIGFIDKLNRTAPKLGLLGMRERAALLGGTVTIESSPGKGTTVYARIPLVTAATESDEHEQETSPAPR